MQNKNMNKSKLPNYNDADGGNVSTKDGNVNNANSVSLKGKIFNIEEEISMQSSETKDISTDVQLLKTDTDSVHGILLQKLNETNEVLRDQLIKMKESMRRYFEDQSRENNKYQQLLEQLKKDKTELSGKVLQLENKMKDLEEVVGLDNY